mmetsp:Transcript_53234/g.99878  ORF Transcript_53234/g.99878 Transcript_53234/m.99878 type:complete len:257 (+) Transcript_53234:84-854(+)
MAPPGPFGLGTAVCVALAGVGLWRAAPDGKSAQPAALPLQFESQQPVPLLAAPPVTALVTKALSTDPQDGEEKEGAPELWFSAHRAAYLVAAAVFGDMLLAVATAVGAVVCMWRSKPRRLQQWWMQRRRQQQMPEATVMEKLADARAADVQSARELPALGSASFRLRFEKPVIQPQSMHVPTDEDEIAELTASADGDFSQKENTIDREGKEVALESLCDTAATTAPCLPNDCKATCSPLPHSPTPCRSSRPGPNVA